MKYKKRFVLFCTGFVLLLGFISLGYAAQYANNISLTGSARIKKNFLANGLEALIQEDHTHKLVAFEIIVKTGSFHEGNQLGSGLAHLVEHMLFKGTRESSVGRIEDEVKSLGGQINGYTAHQITGYTLVLPSQFTREGLLLLADMIRNPLFDAEELEKEKEVILSEIRMNHDDPQRYLQLLLWRNAYSSAPYNIPVIGLEPLFKKLNRDDAVAFHKKWYIPNNMIISIAGDVAAEEIMDEVSSAFSGMSMSVFPKKSLPQPSFLQGHTDYNEEYETKTTYMDIAFPGVPLTHPDAAVLDVLAVILAQGESSRLYKALYKEKQLVYGVSAYNYTPGFPGMFIIKTMLDFENKQKVLDEVFTQIQQLAENGLTDEELEKAKNVFLHDYLSSQETVESKALTMAWDEAYAGNPYFSEQYLDTAARITVKDVQRCVNAYLKQNRFVSVALRPPQKKEEKNIFKTPEPLTAVKELTLKNGVRLLLRKNTTQPLVSIQVCMEGGTRWENEENNGTFNLLARMLLKGTKKRGAEKIAADIENMGASLSPFSGVNSFGLSCSLLKKDARKGMEFISEMLNDSIFPEKELTLEKNLTLRKLEIQSDNIFQDTYNRLKAELFKSYPYRLNILGSPQSIAAISAKYLKEQYRFFCRPDNTVVSVFGDFDEQGIIRLAEKLFSPGRMPRQKEAPVFQEPGRSRQMIVKNKRDKKQAVFMLAFPGTDIKDSDRYVLEFLNYILTAPGGVLYKRIREQLGVSYTLGGDYVSGLDTGYFFVYAATTKEMVEAVRKCIAEEIEKIKSGELDARIIETTRNYMLGKRQTERQSNASLSFACALDELYGLGARHYLTADEQISAVTRERLIDAARKYLLNDNSVIVITEE
ncbi:MAG: insulinase family protein [Candidatus Omnitrophica bacterium]|nr:insulinase family protein [Candidatus Omnitrophota bacterium]